MFGTNAIAKPMHNPNGDLLVNDLFYTLQGEGPDAGRPAIFLRLAKCNLRCYFCDTEFEKATPMPLDHILNEVRILSEVNECRLLVLTGGEPLLQNVIPLVTAVNKMNITVSVETAGTVFPEGLNQLFKSKRAHSPHGNMIVISPKTPKLNYDVARCAGALKYIINHGEVDVDDGLPNMSTQTPGQIVKLFRPSGGTMSGVPIYVQAMDFGDDDYRSKRNLLLAATIAMKHGYRLSVQLHKLAQLP
jgi:7-carboxy-7-deazaguanine synthase